MAWRGPTSPNTNPVPNPINNGSNFANSVKTENRANQIRRDTDKQKGFSITLLDVDTTIFSHLNNTVNPTVIDNGHQVKVPINYASPERWKAIRKDGYMRDKNGKVQCPAIVLRRTTMQRNDQLITFNRYMSMSAVRTYSEKNKYDQFNVMNGFKPTQEIYSLALPDHVVINYDFTIWTEKNEQLNSIVEQINWATEDYWGDKRRFKFRTSISDYSFQIETQSDQDRMVRATFTMMVYAYLLPETFENKKSTLQKSFTKRKVVFNTEVAGTADEFRKKLFGEPTQSIKPNVVMGELEDAKNYIDGTDFQTGISDFNKVWDFQSEYMTKTGSVVSLDNGSGSTVLEFTNTQFITSSVDTDLYRQLIVYVDDVQLETNYVTYYQSGSSIYTEVKNNVSGINITTSSFIVGYGNIY